MEGVERSMHVLRTTARKESKQSEYADLDGMMTMVDREFQRTIQLAAEKGALSWLICRLLQKHHRLHAAQGGLSCYRMRCASGMGEIQPIYLQHVPRECLSPSPTARCVLLTAILHCETIK